MGGPGDGEGAAEVCQAKKMGEPVYIPSDRDISAGVFMFCMFLLQKGQTRYTQVNHEHPKRSKEKGDLHSGKEKEVAWVLQQLQACLECDVR